MVSPDRAQFHHVTDAHCAGVFKNPAASRAETWITQHMWDELRLELCDITAPCDFFPLSHILYTFSYHVHTSTRVETHMQTLVGSGGDENRA